MGTNEKIGGGGFHHVAIRARDFDRTVGFYTEALGFEPRLSWGEAPKRAIMLDTGDGNYLEVFERPTESGDGNGPILHFALRTASVDEAIERAHAAGAEVTVEPKAVELHNTLPGGGPVPVRIAFCKGPDGELIEFFQNEDT